MVTAEFYKDSHKAWSMCLLHLKRCLEIAGGEKEEVVSAEFILAEEMAIGDELCAGLGGIGKGKEKMSRYNVLLLLQMGLTQL